MASTGFSEGSKVVVEQVDDVNWRVREAFSYTGRDLETFHVHVGMKTDFASVPRAFVWFLPRYGAYTKAAILHDLLWRERAAAKLMSYHDADGLFRRAMRELDVPFLRRWIMWAAVRWGALVKPGGRTGWLQDAWRVALVTLIALPIVVPPGILVVVALGLFYVLEQIVYRPLKVIAWWQERHEAQAAKKVVAPTFEWKAT